MAALTAALARRALRQFSTSERAVGAARFFKTGKGEYAIERLTPAERAKWMGMGTRGRAERIQNG